MYIYVFFFFPNQTGWWMMMTHCPSQLSDLDPPMMRLRGPTSPITFQISAPTHGYTQRGGRGPRAINRRLNRVGWRALDLLIIAYNNIITHQQILSQKIGWFHSIESMGVWIPPLHTPLHVSCCGGVCSQSFQSLSPDSDIHLDRVGSVDYWVDPKPNLVKQLSYIMLNSVLLA